MSFKPGHKKVGGRRKGSLNHSTRLARRLAQHILTDEKYLKDLRARMIDDQPSPAIERMLWSYAFGEPLNPNAAKRPAGETDAGRRSGPRVGLGQRTRRRS